jgi:hypothetical protein
MNPRQDHSKESRTAPPEALASELRPFDAIDLAQRCAALQLCPENAQLLFRLEHLSFVVAASPSTRDARRMSPRRLQRMVESGLGIAHLEDPIGKPFTRSLAFTGGNYIVLPGLTEGLQPGVDLLLSAAMLSPRLDANRHFRAAIAHPCQAILRLSDAMCTKAGLKRGTTPSQGHRLIVPSGDRQQRLMEAVLWTHADLVRLFAGTNLRPEHLTCFQLNPGVALPAEIQPGYGPLLTQPLLTIDGGLLIALPHALLTALSRFVLSQAASYGVLEPLTLALHERAVAACAASLDRMGHVQLRRPPAIRSELPCVTEEFRYIDRDKLLHVIVATDDLRAYSDTEAFGKAGYPSGSDVDARFRAGLAEARARTPVPREVLGLLALCGIGRHAAIGLSGGDEQQELLTADLSEILALGYLEPADPLYLWNFSRARRRLRARATAVAFSFADELACYRRHDSSFYLSDKAAPDHLSFAPNSGDGLMLAVEHRYDPHALGAPSRGFQQYVRVYPGSTIPVYCPQQPNEDEAVQCVELDEGALWVTTPIHRRSSDAASMMLHLVDALAFWLARMADHAFVRRAAAARLTIKLIASDAENWRYPTVDAQSPAYDLAVAVQDDDDSVVTIAFPPETMLFVTGVVEDGERRLLRGACRAIAERQGIDPADADAALAATLSTPKHRKVIPLSLQDSIAARPRSLPPPPLVSAAAEHEILDHIGGWLDSSGFGVGPIPLARRTEALNGIVKLLFEQFTSTIAQLCPGSLLEWLVAHNEAIIDEHELLLHREPFVLASFGVHVEPAKEFADRLFEIFKADLASRFMIEYVAARPPTGTDPISCSAYHRLQALAAKIIFFGMLSDDIRYGTDSPELERLPSGRIGISESKRIEARGQFAEAYGLSRRHSLTREEQDDPLWVIAKQADAERKIEAAASAEFGFSLSQHSAIVGAALQLCVDVGDAVTRVSRARLVAAIQEATGVDAQTAGRRVDDLSLGPRDDFFEVPAPAKHEDVYPWRYNRRWSYVRRPFLLDGDDVVLGSSHVDRAGQYLKHLCFSGRLKADSGPMRQALGYMTDAKGARFNQKVARILRGCASLIVRDRVGKFGAHKIKHTLGDVDVLVADERTRRIRAYECKDLSVARTAPELHRELKQLGEGDDSFVAKHARRIAWIRDHLDSVLAEIGVQDRKGWNVGGAIVVDQEIMSPYLVTLPVPVLTIARIEAMLSRRQTVE